MKSALWFGLVLIIQSTTAQAMENVRVRIISDNPISSLTTTFAYHLKKDEKYEKFLDGWIESTDERLIVTVHGEGGRSHEFEFDARPGTTTTLTLPQAGEEAHIDHEDPKERNGENRLGRRPGDPSRARNGRKLAPLKKTDGLAEELRQIARGLPRHKAGFVRNVATVTEKTEIPAGPLYAELIELMEYEQAFIRFSLEPLFRLGSSAFIHEQVYPDYATKLENVGDHFSVGCLDDFRKTRSLIWLSAQILGETLTVIQDYSPSPEIWTRALEAVAGFHPQDDSAKAQAILDVLQPLDADLGDLLEVPALEGLLQVFLQQRAYLEKNLKL